MSKIKSFEKFSQEYEDWFSKNNNIYQSELNTISEGSFVVIKAAKSIP